MPELPEVETIKRGLEKHLVGHKILEVKILDLKIFSGKKENLINGQVLAIKRVGKGLIIEFTNEYSLAIHVKMTGQLIYQGPKAMPLSPKVGGVLPNKHTRVIFILDRSAKLFYNDVRRFGWLKVILKNDVMSLPFFKGMGPEPFKDLTVEYLEKIFSKINTPIKTLLMDQAKIGGIGNIYANEALWQVKINPKRMANELTRSEVKRLYKAIHDVMEESIRHGASSSENYVDALGQEGRYQEHFEVYGRTGEQCNRCGNKIERIVIGGRGTFVCMRCQV